MIDARRFEVADTGKWLVLLSFRLKSSLVVAKHNSLLTLYHIFFRFVKKKFEELYFQSTAPECVDRVFKIYRTSALDQKLIKKTFKLVDETLRRRNLFEAGLL